MWQKLSIKSTPHWLGSSPCRLLWTSRDSKGCHRRGRVGSKGTDVTHALESLRQQGMSPTGRVGSKGTEMSHHGRGRHVDFDLAPSSLPPDRCSFTRQPTVISHSSSNSLQSTAHRCFTKTIKGLESLAATAGSSQDVPTPQEHAHKSGCRRQAWRSLSRDAHPARSCKAAGRRATPARHRQTVTDRHCR